ncbi:MAG: endonuclease/exonuclease/phosphatase family protein [Phycisphaerae bacterium]
MRSAIIFAVVVGGALGFVGGAGFMRMMLPEPQPTVSAPNSIRPVTDPGVRIAAGNTAEKMPNYGVPANWSNTLRVATYNIENLFDQYDNPYTADEGTGAKPEAKVKALVAAIKTLNCDVLVLEEVEQGGYLAKLTSDLLPEFKVVVDPPSNDPRGITVAVLSKLPVTRIVSHKTVALEPPATPEAMPTEFARDLIQVDVELAPGLDLSVYGVHLKSKRDATGDPKGARKRLAEAKKAVSIIRHEQGATGLFLIAGDFNDTPDSAAFSTLLATVPGMVDVQAGRPLAQRISFVNPRYREAIDNIFLSPQLGQAYVADSAKIWWGENFDTASDHRPLSITLRRP